MNKAHYRPEVDGLRTLAVVPVVLFHAGFTVFSGGFIGVDIFFVISGYLISRIILQEVAEGRFSFARFYERRIRRIIPALLVVVLVTLAFASWIALPDQLMDAAKSALAAMLSVSNIWFWKQSGYFSAAAEFMPLLHTWSLAVEEQFYILFPIAILILVRLRLRVGLTLALLLLPAFAFSVWMSFNKPSAAFYLLPARAWELGLGALLASGFIPPIRHALLREAAALAGLACIVFGIFWVDNSMPFPGWAALLPCLGAGLIIHAAGQGGVVYRLLSLPPMVFIGLISYSLYLWHWPVFSLMRLYEATVHLSTAHALFGIALSFMLAVLTWRYVERPFRGSRMPFRRVAAVLSGGAVLASAASVALVITAGLPGRLNDEAQRLVAASRDIDRLVDACESGWDMAACRFGPANKPVSYMIVGDSHAAALRPAFDRTIAGLDGDGIMWWHGICPMLEGARLSHGDPGGACADFRTRVMAALRAEPEITTVILAARWNYYLTGVMAENRGSARNYLVDPITIKASAEESRQVFERSIGRTLDELTAMGKRVIIVGGLPEPGFDVPQIFALAALHGQPAPSPVIDVARAEAGRQTLDDILEKATRTRPSTYYIPVEEALCSQQQCRLLMDQTPAFHDDDHLSTRAASQLLGPLLQDRVAKVLLTQHETAAGCAAAPGGGC